MRKNSALALNLFLLLLLFSPLGKDSLRAEALDGCTGDALSLSCASLAFGPLTNLPDSNFFQVNDCSMTAGVCLDIAVVDISNFQIFDNGSSYANGIAGCDFDSLTMYKYDGLTGQGSGLYLLKQWQINGSSFSTAFNSIDALVDSMNVWDPVGNWQNEGTSMRILGGNSANTYSDMTIFVNATMLDEFLTAESFISPKGTELQFAVGAHEIVLVETSTLIRDTFDVWVMCIQPETRNESILVNMPDTICLDWSQLFTQPDTVWSECASSNSPITYSMTDNDSCVILQGLQPGLDTICYIACDSVGLCDTIHIYSTVESALGYREFYDTLVDFQSKTTCLNSSVFLGRPDTLLNYCIELSGKNVAFQLDPLNFCVDYSTISLGGTDEACIIMCDTMAGECDTTRMFITVRRLAPQYIEDSVYVNTIDSFCRWDLSNLNAPLDTIINICESNSGDYVAFTVDPVTLCVEYEGVDIGIDTACLVLVDTFGNTDTAFLIIESKLPDFKQTIDTIRPGLIVSYCLDSTELGGILLDTITLCNDVVGRAVNYTLNTDTYCLDVEGMFPGTDTICTIICDDFNVCDTTQFVITVSPVPGLPPLARNDIDTTKRNEPIVLNILGNDDLPNFDPSRFQLYVILPSQGGIGPNNGTTLVNSDGTLQYIPDSLYCGATESFEYVICNNVACDTAQVDIYIECPASDLKFYNGFSPNGDRINDTFVIEGIENYPDHTLYVFNRWGNQVLKTGDYKNDWSGTWKGTDLTDGLYFYLFEDGNGGSVSGYVLIAR